MTQDTHHPFETLTPSLLMDAVESQGYVCDGRLLALNSYENRVYQVGIEEQQPLIAKFYRPFRWSLEQIKEEHAFCTELAAQELPVVAPCVGADGESIFQYEAGGSRFYFALYPRKGGHAPELDNLDNLLILGRLLGRIHLIGASQPFIHRPTINRQNFGYECIELIGDKFMPGELQTAYRTLTDDIMKIIEETMQSSNDIDYIRTHGDCHIGNILWRDDMPHFVDFDDARMAPAIQDIWMLLSGDRVNQTAQLAEIVEGYREFFDFHPKELKVLEVLRTLRMIHYSAWLARRWDDPAFPMNFPWFNTVRYWEEHILDLREQFAALREPALVLV